MSVGALFGLAEYQYRVGHQYPVLIATPLLVGIVPLVQPGALQALLMTGDGGAPIGLAVSAMIGGFALSGRGHRIRTGRIRGELGFPQRQIGEVVNNRADRGR